MDVDLQAKLLRVLQLGQFERVGGDTTLRTDVRIISATNRDLRTRIAEEAFREDLFYRLNVVTIELPPLRERPSDIPLLAEHILRKLSQKYDWPQLRLSQPACEQLQASPWPGNVRELQNTLARAAILSGGRVIQANDLQSQTASAEPATPPIAGGSLVLRDILAQTELRVIRQALEQAGWNRTRAAQILEISRRQLFDKIRQFGLHEES
jgi:DNA-binding NtrC family response regulator